MVMKLESTKIRKAYQCTSTPDTETKAIVRQYSVLLIKTVSSPLKQIQIESLLKKEKKKMGMEERKRERERRNRERKTER